MSLVVGGIKVNKKVWLSQDGINQLKGDSGMSTACTEKTVWGWGIRDVKFRVWIDGKFVWQYQLWQSIVRRSNSEFCHGKNPAYANVKCSDKWQRFSDFLYWVNEEVGYKGRPQGCDFDKDILGGEAKMYSPDYCSFVPRKVNLVIMCDKSCKGVYPTGVNHHKRTGKLVAQTSYDGKKIHLGLFDDPMEAFHCYKKAKEAQIKLVADEYRQSLRDDVYAALMRWEVKP